MLSKSFKCLMLFWVVLICVTGQTTLLMGQTTSNTDIANRLKRLELELRDLHLHLFSDSKERSSLPVSESSQKKVEQNKNNALSGGRSTSAVQTLVKLQSLEGVVRSLQGAAEELNNRLDKLVSDLDTRLAALEAKNRPITNGQEKNDLGTDALISPPSATSFIKQKKDGGRVLGYISDGDIKANEKRGDQKIAVHQNPRLPYRAKLSSSSQKPTLLPEGDIATRYKHAFTYLRKREFQKAELALQEFLKAHPNDPLAANAMYWLGESYYARKKFEEAADIFVSGYEKFPLSSKTPDNLLKLGFSLVRLQRPQDACIAFSQLLTEFPKSSAIVKRRASNESKRIGCTGS